MIKFIPILAAFAGVALGQWAQLPGQAVDVSARGDEVWSVHRNGTIYRLNLHTLTWEKVSSNVSNKQPFNGKPVFVAASPDGYTWMTTDKYNIYRWNNQSQIWDLRNGLLKQISSTSKSLLVGTSHINDMFEYENQRATGWIQLPGKALWVSTGKKQPMLDDRHERKILPLG